MPLDEVANMVEESEPIDDSDTLMEEAVEEDLEAVPEEAEA